MLCSKVEIEDKMRVREALHDLRMGAIRGDLEAVKYALTSGVSVNQTVKGGWTALMYACSLAHPVVVEFLLQQGAKPNFHKELFTPLMAVCASTQENENRLVQCVNILLRHKASVNMTERHNLTALMFAAKEGRAKVTARLLDTDLCDIDARDSQGWTALFWAVNQGRAEVVAVLVKREASLTLRDRRGHTVLDLACSRGFENIINILMSSHTGPLFRPPQLDRPPDTKPQYVFGKGTDSMLQAFLDELSGSIINKNDKCNNNISNLLNSKELENNMEELKAHAIASKTYQPLNGYFQNSLLLYNRISNHSAEKQIKSVETSWKNISYSMLEAREALGQVVKHAEALYATVAYVRLHLQGHPPAALVQDKFAHISEVTALSKKALHCTRLLYDELHFFHEYAKQLEESDQVVPADFVMEQKTDRCCTAAMSSLLIAAAVVVMIFNSRIFTLSMFSK